MSKSLKVTLSDGIVNEYDTMNAAKKALGIKSYTPIYFALKNKGLHPKFGWHIQRL
jgi:ClpP class serine protease